jgi:hypothetical protein
VIGAVKESTSKNESPGPRITTKKNYKTKMSYIKLKFKKLIHWSSEAIKDFE